MTLRVVIADDNLLVREGVVKLLDHQEGIEVVGTCGTYDELMEAAAREAPDVVVTDIRMPPTGTDEGVRAALTLRDTQPGDRRRRAEPVRGSGLRARAARAGLGGAGVPAQGARLRPESDRARHHRGGPGRQRHRPGRGRVAGQGPGRRPASPVDRLTPRERDVLEQMAQGRNNAGIAQALHLSERAVEKHINALFSKLGLGEEVDVHRRVKAVLLFLSEQGG